MSEQPLSIAFIAGGQLYVKPGDEPVREIQSQFAQQALARSARVQEHNAWRDRSGVWGSMGMEPPSFNQWQQAGATRKLFRFSSVAAAGDRSLFYALDMGDVGGLFRYNLEDDTEIRLMHREGFSTRDLSWHPADDLFAFSVPLVDGTLGISIGENEGRRMRRISGGDSMDECPSWVRDGSRRFVFQTAPIGRDVQGFPRGLGPYEIELADADSENVVPCVHEEDRDCLAPKMTADGTLFYISRPHQSQPDAHDPLTVLKDIVLFPFRFVRAVFYFFNFLSMMFTGKPLATDLQPNNQGPEEQRHLALWGQMIDTRVALQNAKKEKRGTAIAPATWDLMRRPDGHNAEAIAHGVLAYDVCSDGSVVYSDGSTIFHLPKSGEARSVCSGNLIEHLAVLGPLATEETEAAAETE